jgi:ABC-type branched-subunit amino acid transport system ATPase component
MNSVPYLHVKNLSKVHVRGGFRRQVVFQLQADFEIQGAGIVAIVGPNGAGKTTLFELIAGREMPTSGQVICHGQNIHRVKCEQRRQVVNHHQQPEVVAQI